MVANNYYRVSALPALGDLGTPPPISLADLREHLAEPTPPKQPLRLRRLDAGRAQALVEALLLADDLMQREAVLAGEIQDASPAILAAAQVRGDEALPDYLAPADEPAPPRVASDAVWAAYFHHAAGLAARLSSLFLAEWIAEEVALRNALVAARAQALGLEAAHYLVAADLGRSDEDFAPLISEWSAAADPLAGLRVLDRARWTWLVEHDGWFSFADDELAAYAAKLILLVRWQRLSAEAHR